MYLLCGVFISANHLRFTVDYSVHSCPAEDSEHNCNSAGSAADTVAGIPADNFADIPAGNSVDNFADIPAGNSADTVADIPADNYNSAD